MRRNPLVPVAIAFMTGIAGQHWLTGLPDWFWWAMAAVAALIAAILLIARRKPSLLPTLLAALLCIASIGGTLGQTCDPRSNPNDWSRLAACDSQLRNYTGRPSPVYLTLHLTETPQPLERSWHTKATVERCNGATCDGRIDLFLKKETTSSSLRYGDRLMLHGYPDLERRLIYITSDHYIVTQHDSRSLRARSEQLRMRLLQRMQRGPLDRRQAGVAEALTLGWKADLSPETKASYRDAGIAHLLAVSGLHTGLVALAAGLLLAWIPKTRRGRAVKGTLQLAAIWAFAMITGMAPSTMRAALMFSLFIVSDIFERGTPKMNLLAAAALLTLAARPMLLFDTGWQLSYSAVAGILLARPLITLFHNWLWQTATVSIAATMATMPVTLATFHQIHPYFLIANMVIIPLAGVILMMALAYMAIPCTATALPLGKVLEWSGWLTEQVSGLPGAVVETETQSGWATAILAIAILALLMAANITTRKVSQEAD